MKKTMMTTLLVLGVGLCASASMLENFEFNDSAGTDLNDATNSVPGGSVWNFNTPDEVTDGNGVYNIKGDSGPYTRKFASNYAAPYTTGKYRFEVVFDSWNVNAGSANGTAADDNISFGMNTSSDVTAEQRLARIALQLKDSEVTIQFSGDEGNYRTQSFSLVQEGPVAAAIEFDFDNDTLEYFIDGTSFFTGVLTNSVDMAGGIWSKGGAWTTSATSIAVDSFSVEIIPEPATLGLIGLFGASILFVRSRFML